MAKHGLDDLEAHAELLHSSGHGAAQIMHMRPRINLRCLVEPILRPRDPSPIPASFRLSSKREADLPMSGQLLQNGHGGSRERDGVGITALGPRTLKLNVGAVDFGPISQGCRSPLGGRRSESKSRMAFPNGPADKSAAAPYCHELLPIGEHAVACEFAARFGKISGGIGFDDAATDCPL